MAKVAKATTSFKSAAAASTEPKSKARASAIAEKAEEERVVASEKKKPAAPSNFSAEFVVLKEKETKGTYRFAEIDEDGDIVSLTDSKIGSLYARKSNFSKAPARIRVTVEILE